MDTITIVYSAVCKYTHKFQNWFCSQIPHTHAICNGCGSYSVVSLTSLCICSVAAQVSQSVNIFVEGCMRWVLQMCSLFPMSKYLVMHNSISGLLIQFLRRAS